MAPIVSRGFRGRRAADVDPARVPPGQYVTADFPVLSAGPTPHTSLELWDFSIVGELAEPRGWTWEEFRALPSEEITRDIHCVTKWIEARHRSGEASRSTHSSKGSRRQRRT